MPRNVIEDDAILEKGKLLGSKYRIAEVAFDRWGATRISTQLQDADFTQVEFGQGYARMSAPTKELLRLVLDGRIGHGGHPVKSGRADNVTVEQDAAGNVKASKGKSREKFDGIVGCSVEAGASKRTWGGPWTSVGPGSWSRRQGMVAGVPIDPKSETARRPVRRSYTRRQRRRCTLP
jgi:hypothetical protein